MLIKVIACGGLHTCAVTDKGALYAWGGGHPGQLGLKPQTGFVSCTPNESEVMLHNIPVLVILTGCLWTLSHSFLLKMEEFMDGVTIVMVRLLMRNQHMLDILPQLIGPNDVAAGVRARHSRCHAAWINGLKAAIRDPDQNELL